MPEELRQAIDERMLRHLAGLLEQASSSFRKSLFLKDMEEGFEHLALKQRLSRLVVTSRTHLPEDFRTAVQILLEISPEVGSDLAHLFIPEYIAAYGLDDRDFALEALKKATCYSSSEFAIREFLLRDFDHTLGVMSGWAEDENSHVRRLASEGLRPRLPWSFHLKNLIVDPSPVFPVLEKLKTDPELYVRKSVANHLNDISRDNAEQMLDLVDGWDRADKRTAWIVKHACRSLIKSGHPRSFSLFGYEENPQVELVDLEVRHESLRLGQEQQFHFSLRSLADRVQKLVVDYMLSYVKKNGRSQPKVFKLSEVSLEPGMEVQLSKTQKFQNFTTRKHYSGQHEITILVNGKALESAGFHLEC